MIRHFCDFCGNNYQYDTRHNHSLVTTTIEYLIKSENKLELCDECYRKIMQLKMFGSTNNK